ncbi:retron St85 family RNA-directed DNA polymerase [uncultured Roseovarius sp.]|uniref:retron St85 family RNA-directed DNA polymerase n=1 Tax=uncultured Roseovarius sp. TaxID=293344 RepID=UPI0025924202|nr:retron St85 family RNA-directed DNA polymerase [uncultured Roseovarius sp.]
MEKTYSLEDWQDFFDQRVRGHKNLVRGYLKYIERLEQKKLPPIFELRHLSSLLGIEERLLVSLVQAPASFYREFQIPKKRGGFRTISVPSPLALNAQRWVLCEILNKMVVHESCYGFIRGRSVVDNARKHLGNHALLKLDLKDFFPSITMNRVTKIFLRAGYPVSVSYFLARICCLNRRLPQGAATSPMLSNLVAVRLDAGLTEYAEERGLVYTRYADDLTFSGSKIGSTEIEQIGYIISEQGFTLNEKKTLLRVGQTKKIVTGVSISNGKLALPRSAIREIKLEAYHLLKRGYFEHSKFKEHLDPLLMERILGRIGFWLQIDPENTTARSLQGKLKAYVEQFDASL